MYVIGFGLPETLTHHYMEIAVGDFNATVGTNDCDEWRLFDVSVLPSFDNGLDHRLVRAKLTLNKKIFKVDTHKPAPFRITSLILQELEHAIESYDWECLEDSSEDYNLLVSGLLSDYDSIVTTLDSMNAALIVLVLSVAIAHPAAGQCLRSRVKNIETSYNNNEPFNRFHRRALAEIRAAFIYPNRNPFNNPSLRSRMYRYLLAYVLVRRDGSLPLAVKRLVVYDKLGTKIASVDYNIGLDHEMSPTYELADRNAMEDVLRYCKEDELLPSSIERYLHAHRSEAGERILRSTKNGTSADTSSQTSTPSKKD
ncbi:hypothetical protein Q1695_014668 [Nippostrongylus brasiliensis]|nr:hypothetical protein Q1695_014668 [Nippostrongylus brasiliensis]